VIVDRFLGFSTVSGAEKLTLAPGLSYSGIGSADLSPLPVTGW
jgi:hypothetical protein